MHEDSRRRPLAFMEDSLEQLASIIYSRDSSVEKGAWLWQGYFLPGGISSDQISVISVAE
jgi:hypothetical protein